MVFVGMLYIVNYIVKIEFIFLGVKIYNLNNC